VNTEIISIGTELLLGDIVDTNSAHIARQLRSIGLDVHYMTTVGDNLERIVQVLHIALDRVNVVITTGGLGPTVDDVTREAVAQATNRPLVLDSDLLAEIEAFFSRLGYQMKENNRRQAYIPEGAIPIPNAVGTAPGFIVEDHRGVVISLPGVPREMVYLLEHAVLPYLREHMDVIAVIKSRVLRTVGIGESSIDARIADLMTYANPTVGLAAHAGQTDVRITAKAPTEEEADRMLADMEAQLRQRLGDVIYGVDGETVEEVVTRLLRERGWSLALVHLPPETGLRERLEVAGIDVHLVDIQPHRATPTKESATDLARRARDTAKTDVGLVVWPYKEGEIPATYVAVVSPAGQKVVRLAYVPESPHRKRWVANVALDLLRRQALPKEHET